MRLSHAVTGHLALFPVSPGDPHEYRGRPGVQGPARGPGWPARGSGAGQGSRVAGQGFRGRPGVQGGRPGVQGPARGPGWPARGSGAGPFPTRGPDLFAPILKSSVINL